MPCGREGGGEVLVVLETIYNTAGLLHSVWEQIQSLQNCLTTPTQNLGGEEASEKKTAAAQSPPPGYL
jgi:hypothetical protein